MASEAVEATQATEIVWEGASELREKLIPIDDFTPFPENPDRSDVYLPAIAYSLREFGQTRPILTWANAEEFGYPTNTIIGGHHVRRAAKTYTDWTHIAATGHEFESYEKAREYLVLDNALSQREAGEMRDQLSLLSGADEVPELATIFTVAGHAPELRKLDDLRAHPDNYKEHPEDQLKHITASLDALGFYKPIVIAKDGTVLAGHGVMKAAAMLGLENVPVKRMDIEPDSPEAKMILAGDNEIGKRGELDDRQMAETLRQLHEETGNLIGSGYDVETFALLLLSTRTAAEIKDANEAAEWMQLPTFEKVPTPHKLIVNFDSAEERSEFMQKLEVDLHEKANLNAISIWWPPRERNDPGSVRFVDIGRDKWKEHR